MDSRTRKKNLPKSTKEMSQEMLIKTLKKKRECNSRALAIVERLCDSSVLDEERFLAQLQYINRTHFEDVIVERAILKLCGYPMCKGILENVPSKKYHISTRQNKVFDITERKNFCSNACYKAATYLKNQLLTSPLWFRDQEIIPRFKLLSCPSLSMGEEVVFLPEREYLKKEVLSEENIEKAASNLIGKLDEITLHEGEEHMEKTLFVSKHDGKTKEIKVETGVTSVEQKEDTSVVLKEIDGNNELFEESKVKVTKIIPLDPVKKVEKCIYEWFTFDTVLYLYGEDKVKELTKDRRDEIKSSLGAKPLIANYREKIDRMITFYSLFVQQSDCDSSVKNLKPLPDYSAIKEDGNKLEVKVRAFFSGQLEVPDCGAFKKKKEEDSSETDEIVLPHVDTHSQNTLRMKILLDRFNRIIPELIRTFSTGSCFEVSELRNLVNHFTLSAHNITFKPGEWYLIGFIVIKLLSIKNKQLECLLKNETGKKHVTLLLMNYGLPANYLDNVLEWLMNVDDLIKKLT